MAAATPLHRTKVPTPAAADLAEDEVVVAAYGPPNAKGLVRFYGFRLDTTAPAGVRRQTYQRDLSYFVFRRKHEGLVVTGRDAYTLGLLAATVDPLNVEIGVDRIRHHHGAAPILNHLEVDLVVATVMARGDVTARRCAERLHMHRRVVERVLDRLAALESSAA